MFSWNKSLKNRSTNWIHKTNLLNTVGQNKSTKRIFWKQYGFANPKPRIGMDLGFFKVRLCIKDSSGFVGFVKTGRFFFKISLWIESLRIELANPDSRIYEVGFVNHETKWIFLGSGFVITIWNKSMDLQNWSMFLQISYTIPASLQIRHSGKLLKTFAEPRLSNTGID